MKKTIIAIMALPLILVTLASCNQNKENNSADSEVEWEITHMEEVDEKPAVEPEIQPTGNQDTLSTQSGLRYIILQQGAGPRPQNGQTVKVHYTGFLLDGSKFDSSVDRAQPFTFAIGTGAVIKGWDEGIALLNVGTKARLIIPHELAYGERGMPPVIPPGSTLLFDVELLVIQ